MRQKPSSLQEHQVATHSLDSNTARTTSARHSVRLQFNNKKKWFRETILRILVGAFTINIDHARVKGKNRIKSLQWDFVRRSKTRCQPLIVHVLLFVEKIGLGIGCISFNLKYVVRLGWNTRTSKRE
jgi:hypothetical protein